MGKPQHVRVVDREHGRKAPAHRSQPSREVQQARAGPPRGDGDAELVPPQVSGRRAQPIHRRSAAGLGWGEPAGDGPQAVAEDAAEGPLQLRDVHPGPPAHEFRNSGVERDAPVAHGPAVSARRATVVTEPAIQKKR